MIDVYRSLVYICQTVRQKFTNVAAMEAKMQKQICATQRCSSDSADDYQNQSVSRPLIPVKVLNQHLEVVPRAGTWQQELKVSQLVFDCRRRETSKDPVCNHPERMRTWERTVRQTRVSELLYPPCKTIRWGCFGSVSIWLQLFQRKNTVFGFQKEKLFWPQLKPLKKTSRC